jgi:hypothetical protein
MTKIRKTKIAESPMDRLRKVTEENKRQLEGLQAEYQRLRIAIERQSEVTFKGFNDIGKVSAHNSQVLCEYVDDIADRLYGVALTLYAYTEAVAHILEEDSLHEKGWAPRITEEILLGAATRSRQQRIAAMEKRKEEKKEKEGPMEFLKPLDQMTDAELNEAVKTPTDAPAEKYPAGTQFFGE